MVNETTLKDLIKRERRLIETLDTGSDEYVSSMKRLMELEKLLSEIEKNEAEMDQTQKSRHMETILEWAKVAVSIAMPTFGLFYIVSKEEGITFTGAMRDVTKCFLPRNKI